MPRTEFNLSRQLQASVILATTLRSNFDTPEAIAQRLAAIREDQISRIEKIIADESEHLSNSVTWRDAFCHECDYSECMQGTARDLAIKIHDLGWRNPTKRFPHLNCLKCQGEVGHAAN